MFKFLKRLFMLSLILIICIGIWGHQQGLTVADYQDFIADFYEKYLREGSSSQEEETQEIGEQQETAPRNGDRPAPESSESLLSPPRNPFQQIDRHARNSPPAVETTVSTLAAYLEEKTTTELDKARSIYVWLTENIRYDDDAYNSNTYGDYSAEKVLRSRQAVCEGYSNLFLALGREMDLEIEKITGYAKGYGYKAGTRFKVANHAWNAVKIAGEWRIFDATWGTGNGSNVRGRLVSKKEFDDYWFNVDPYQAIFNHFPEDPQFSFVQPVITLAQYERLPYLTAAYFKLGFDGAAIYRKAIVDQQLQFPEVYSTKTFVKVHSAPEYKLLPRDQTIEFDLFVPEGLKVAAIDAAKNWKFFERKNGRFRLNYVPQKRGEVKIGVQHKNSGKSFETVLVYQVVNRQQNF
ncbi:transglutaminase domain-containing protein [Flavilitoribacter nigricans]|uniref:Transglutaminase-like domain-containing protein n=1 Tax=Flavilitoribacter nigricans (strain ATCC 23147 / DSM 23189 / NBRC 102662 / NCIMB 1420 / SS-2) TaxID=1122177 RepID=A0A2D0NFH5_FLAN2|nr:transglutaminase domain-containing protein [Flavilitoribacter nigricans]PHN07252.1 hypothetical protein CRP01_06380 [Flavilitoribacter nigricans DSM 23189 = NBRC 102662]